MTLCSNTKAGLFIKYATQLASFRRAWATGGSTALADLGRLDPEKGCPLGYAARMVQALSAGLRADPANAGRLAAVQGTVQRLERVGALWRLQADRCVVECDRVVLATGSHPRELPGAIEPVPLDEVLQPALCRQRIGPADTVAVMGSSHSAMLAVKTLLELPERPRVVNLYRSPLKFAEYLEDGRIRHDNTGLKGDVACWVRAHVRDATDGPAVMLEGALERVLLQRGAGSAAQLQQCTKLVAAVGYERNALPVVIYSGQAVCPAGYTDSGQLTAPDGQPLAGLYGVGIAFPERVQDVDGSPELAVGLWKFMRHIDRIVPAMVPCVPR